MTKLTERGKRYVEKQMKRFTDGGLLRTNAGKKLDPHKSADRSQALAIFHREAKTGQKKGFSQRTYKGSKRERPNK